MTEETYITALVGGASVLTGKIIWDWLRPSNGKQPMTKSECETQHAGLSKLLDERNKVLSKSLDDIKDDQKTAFKKIDDIFCNLLEKK